MKRLVIIPAFNEGPVIFKTISSLKQELGKSAKFDIVVINDGSEDNTALQAAKAKVKILHHHLNRGLGGALGTGLEYAKRQGYDLAITFDADGQHHPSDVIKAVQPIEKNRADLVVGTRMKSKEGQMPIDRRVINLTSNIVTWVLFGIWTSDSQSGFRAFSKKAIDCIRIKTERMEVSSEIFSEVKKHRLKVTEVPIRVIYTTYSRSKGQDNLNAVNVLFKLLLRLFR